MRALLASCCWVAWIALGAPQALAQARAQDAAVLAADEAAPRAFTLANGMTLLVKVDRRAPTAVHMLWVRVGSIDEVDGTSGVAHVLEQKVFKGTTGMGTGG